MSNDKLFVCCECSKGITYDHYDKDGLAYFDSEGYIVGFKCLDESVICDECYARDSEIKE